MKLTLTSMQGNTKDIKLASREQVLEFIELYQKTLHENQRIKVTCDLIGIDGYMQGDKIQKIMILQKVENTLNIVTF